MSNLLLHRNFVIAVVSTVDPDAQAFINAAGLTVQAQKDAIIALVKDFKAANCWTGLAGFWPFVGGTATAHAVNLRSPGTYDLTFPVAPLHNANGVTFNGVDQYAKCNLIMGTVLPLSGGYAQDLYSRTAANGNGIDMGFSGGNQMLLTAGGLPTTVGSGRSAGQSTVNGTSTTGQGLFTIDQQPGGVARFYHNGAAEATVTGTDVALNTLDSFIGAVNGGTPSFYSTRNVAAAAIRNYFTATQVSAYYTAVQKFQTALARQV